MRSPLIGLAFFGVMFVGVVLLWQGATGRDRDLLGFGSIASLFGTDRRWQQEAVDRVHPPERHPTRLMAAGLALIALGLVGIVAWSLLTE